MATQARDHAIVIGVDDYPKWPNKSLRGAVNDAQNIFHWLKDNQGGGVPETQCHLILSEVTPPRPISDTIDDVIEKLFDAIGSEQQRRLYFFFSGHGISNLDYSDVNLCLAKFNPYKRIGACLSSKAYNKQFVLKGLFREIVFWLDCCRNIRTSATGSEPQSQTSIAGEDADDVKLYTAYSTRFTHQSFETPGEEGVSRGIFTECLLDGLKYAHNGMLGVKGRTLKAYLEREVPMRAKGAGMPAQNPDITIRCEESEEIIFGSSCEASSKQEFQFTLKTEKPGIIILQNGTFEEIHRGNKDQWQEPLFLERGMYRLVHELTGEDKVLQLNGPGVYMEDF